MVQHTCGSTFSAKRFQSQKDELFIAKWAQKLIAKLARHASAHRG